MKIVIASDSFKGSKTAREAGILIEKGIKSFLPEADTYIVPVADGGEGMLAAICSCMDCHIQTVTVKDPLGRDIESRFAITTDNKAVIEMAAASGLTLLEQEERDPRITSTYGTGQLIIAALDAGCKEILIGIGGSATNDGGRGMAEALGYKFFGVHDRMLSVPGGIGLRSLKWIDKTFVDERLNDVKITVAVDVRNKICGRNGASFVYGPQKGARRPDLYRLDGALRNFSSIVKKQSGLKIRKISGGGAAGGLGAGLVYFCNAELKSGIHSILDMIDFNSRLQNTDLIITGEGCLDKQTFDGKVISGIIEKAREYKIPVLAVAGSLKLNEKEIRKLGLEEAVGCRQKGMSLTNTINNSDVLIPKAAEIVLKKYLCR